MSGPPSGPGAAGATTEAEPGKGNDPGGPARTATTPFAAMPAAYAEGKEQAPAAPLPPKPPLLLPPLPPFSGGPAGYRPPFAPRGPYAASSPYAASLGYPPGAPMSPYPGLAPTKPPKKRRERSKLGRITFSLILLSLGVLAALEVTVADFKVSTFFAVPLAITALGLIAGAWLGRARVLILLGALLSIALAIATAAGVAVPHRTENISIQPGTFDELHENYSTDIGDINADLTQLNFAAQEISPTLVRFETRVGNVNITVPENVDVTVKVHIQGGDCQVLGTGCGGFKQTSTINDYGLDGPGGGKLTMDLDVQWGDVRVTR
jgi:hypothetical protein